MTLVKRNYYAPGLSKFFDDFFTRDLFWNGDDSMSRLNSAPAVNIKENEDSFDLELAAPGLNKKDFNIEVDDNLLTISFETKKENEVNEDNYRRREFGYQSFKRSFTLPETVNSEMIKAQYENGVLILELPKKPEAQVQPVKTIKIS